MTADGVGRRPPVHQHPVTVIARDALTVFICGGDRAGVPLHPLHATGDGYRSGVGPPDGDVVCVVTGVPVVVECVILHAFQFRRRSGQPGVVTHRC